MSLSIRVLEIFPLDERVLDMFPLDVRFFHSLPLDIRILDLGHKHFAPATVVLDLDLSLAKVEPVDMSIRVVVGRVDLAAVRVYLLVIKVIPVTAEVDLTKA